MVVDNSAIAIKPMAADAASVRKALARRPVLWVGAGLSIAAGYPSTGRLVGALVAAADDPIAPMSADRSFFAVVDDVVASVGAGRVRDVLQRLFQPARPPAPAHRAIAQLAKAGSFAAIITTNYDDLLERALAEAGAPYVLQPLDRNEAVAGDGVHLLKVHGSYDDWARVVLSGRSYGQFGKRYPFLQAQLAVLLRREPVLFAGCSLQDRRILDWIAELSDDAAEGLKEWRAVMTGAEWQQAIAHTQEGARTVEILGRARVRPLIVKDHDHARDLLVNAAGELPKAADVVTLDLTVSGDTLTAAMPGAGEGPWTPKDPLRDKEFVDELRELRELDHTPLPTDDQGRLAPMVASAAAMLRALAERVGRKLTDTMLTRGAAARLGQAVGAGLGEVPPLFHVRVRAGDSDAERLHADRLLALPWELVVVDGQFPVERATLDVAREAVVPAAAGLGPPDRALSVVAVVSAPVDASRLDHESECYRLWRAMGSQEKRLHLTDTGTVEALLEAMKRVKPLVMHFTGHGEPGALLFEDDEARRVTMPVRELVDKLRLGAMPRLAFLASCHGMSVARLDAIGAAVRGARANAGQAGDTVADTEGAVEADTDAGAVTDTAPDPGSDSVSVAAARAVESGPSSARLIDPALLHAEDPTWSSAAELQREGIPQVVGWFGPVGDRQSTRAEESFYAALVQGKTARQAVREARQKCREALRPTGKAGVVYPLGWAQLALYHRGADAPTALPEKDEKPTSLASEIERTGERFDSRRGPVGVERLKYGFVGRRKARSKLLGRIHAGERLIVVHGLGGLGKTALVAALAFPVALKIAPRDKDGQPIALPVLALDGRFAGENADPVRELWDQVVAALPAWRPKDDAWRARCDEAIAERQKDGIGGSAVVEVLRWFAAEAKGLVVYLDDAESLQEPVSPQAEVGRWRNAEIATFWDELTAMAPRDGSIAVLASTRFLPEGLLSGSVMPLPVMARIDLVHLLSWWRTLRRLSGADTAWLVERLDGHPRSVQWLDALAGEKVAKLVAPGEAYEGDLRREVLEPLLPSLAAKLDADLVLPQLFAALGPDVQGFVRRLGVLARPAPWGALLAIEDQTGTLQRAETAGLVSPFESGEPETRWASHRMVLEKAGTVTGAEATTAHQKLGQWFRAQWEKEPGALGLAQDAAHHLCEAGDGTAAWEPAQRVVLVLRRAGRDREALAWVRRVLAANPTGTARGIALTLDAQLGMRSGDLSPDAEAHLREAEALVDVADRAFVLDELGKLYRRMGSLRKAGAAHASAVEAATAGFETEDHRDVASLLHSLAGVLQAQGDLAGAREHLQRSLRIQAKVFGTEEHPDVAASLHSLAGVLQAQGDLAGAREHLQRSLRIKAKLFGTEEHPEVAASLHSLAGVLQAQGDLAGAREHLQRSLRIKAKVFGTEEHPEVAASLHSLAGVLQAQGDLAGAREHLQRSLRIWAKLFGTEEHPNVAASLNSLAGVLQAQGDLAGARDHYERVLAIKERLYGGREHYLTGVTEANLGALLLQMGNLEQALPLLQHAHDVFYANLGPQHPYTEQLRAFLDSLAPPPPPAVTPGDTCPCGSGQPFVQCHGAPDT